MRASVWHRWTVLLLPAVLPWVLVTWPSGWYVVFAGFWVDPGPRVVTIVEFLSRTTISPFARSYVMAWPLALLLYSSGLATARIVPDRPAISGSMFWLGGLAIGFFALGLSGQGHILAVPVGTLVLWLPASLETWRHVTGGTEPA